MTYVDDITITTDCETMRTEVFNAINKVMKINDCGVIESFLGMRFQYNEQKRYWHITQGTDIKDLCATMGLRQESSKACYTPEVKQVWSTEVSTAKTDEEHVRVSAFSSAQQGGQYPVDHRVLPAGPHALRQEPVAVHDRPRRHGGQGHRAHRAVHAGHCRRGSAAARGRPWCQAARGLRR
jgi:hypothetical protein